MTYQGVPTSAIKKVPVRKAILGTLGWSFAASVTFVLPRGCEGLIENVKSKKTARTGGGAGSRRHGS